jgi:hypothetical protein
MMLQYYGSSSDTGSLIICPWSSYNTAIRMTSGASATITLSAHSGIVMNNNITLPTTISTPSAGQLGYTISSSMSPSYTGGNIPSNNGVYFGAMTLPQGTWMMSAKLTIYPLGSGAVISSCQAGFGPSYTTSLTYTYASSISITLPNATLNTIIQTNTVVTLTATTNYFFFGTIIFTGASSGLTMAVAGSSNPYSTFTATRIA